jgi:hypothetical protein
MEDDNVEEAWCGDSNSVSADECEAPSPPHRRDAHGPHSAAAVVCLGREILDLGEWKGARLGKSEQIRAWLMISPTVGCNAL